MIKYRIAGDTIEEVNIVSEDERHYISDNNIKFSKGIEFYSNWDEACDMLVSVVTQRVRIAEEKYNNEFLHLVKLHLMKKERGE